MARGNRAEPTRRVASTRPNGPVAPGKVERWVRAAHLHPWRSRAGQPIHNPTTLLTRARLAPDAPAHACTMLAQGAGGWGATKQPHSGHGKRLWRPTPRYRRVIG
ncbi:MAG: hypothetical protein J7463_12455 [Roseiflexus sp.]|nr:hypothetical protein [Roseiflexus sp.]MBO9343260.1 hypothetical protein [Roseiflexus sp.]MBO9382428.1 hypothetical protein [Roseiflexus sp.]MBO9388824.1 hypothetical protein [Roseiflexus sp.]